MRQARRHQTKKKKWPKVLGIIAGLLVLLVVLGIVFFTPLNNTYRSVTGNDTPADSAVKNELVKRIEAQKTGNTATDNLLDRAANTVNSTKMSTIIAAANDEQKMATLLQDTTGVSSATAEVAARTLFNTDSLTPLREAVAQGNYVKAYQAYEDLDTSTLTQLKATLAQ